MFTQQFDKQRTLNEYITKDYRNHYAKCFDTSSVTTSQQVLHVTLRYFLAPSRSPIRYPLPSSPYPVRSPPLLSRIYPQHPPRSPSRPPCATTRTCTLPTALSPLRTFSYTNAYLRPPTPLYTYYTAPTPSPVRYIPSYLS